MKKYLLLILTTTIYCNGYSQNIKINDNQNYYEKTPIKITIENLPDNGVFKISLEDFDETQLVKKGDNEASFYFDTKGSYTFKLLNSKNEVIDYLKIKVIENKNFYILNGFTITDVSPTKKSGQPWDNGMGGYFPDVEVYFIINGKRIENKINSSFSSPTIITPRKENLKKEDLPWTYNFKEPLKFPAGEIDKFGLNIKILDSDSISDSDIMFDENIKSSFLNQDVVKINLAENRDVGIILNFEKEKN